MPEKKEQNKQNRNAPGNKNNKLPFGKQPTGSRYPRNMFHWVIMLMLAAMLFTTITNVGKQAEKIPYSEFIQRVKNDSVKEIHISDNTIKGTMKAQVATEGTEPETSENFQTLGPEGIASEADFRELIEKHNVIWYIEQDSYFLQILIGILPWLLIFGVMYFFVLRPMRGGGGGGILGNFGRSKHRVHSTEQSKVTFEDVAGIDEAKDEVQEIIQFLRNPKKFQRLGGRIPRGVLLVGEPGCGKTLLAKAIAGEANVPFFSISGSDFVEMFVGVGASRVRDLFKQAKDSAPCIIFLDEIDAIGRKRGTSIAGGGHDEREQTLNAILVEMDGFSTNDQVIVIAATNRGDILDHALTRTGRFDRQVYVPLPDIKGRMEILRVHAKKVKMEPNVDLHRLARGTPMFSGADLEAIINEAALDATMSNKDYVEMEDLEEARDKVRWGRAKKSRVVDENDKIITAYHEAGHTLVQSLLEYADPIHKVSIIPRANMGGATFSLPEKDRTLHTRQYCLALIKVCFGGRLAEQIFCDDISSGASSDINQATEIARKMITEWGMSEKLGFVHYGQGNGKSFQEMSFTKEYSEQTAELIDAEIKDIMKKAQQEATKLIEDNRSSMEMLKDALMKYETLDSEEVKQLLAGKPLDKPTVSDLLAAEQQRNNKDNQPAIETDTEPTPKTE